MRRYLPDPKTPFRPRADAALFSRLVQDAWTAYQEAMLTGREAVAEIVAAHVEGLVPAADLVVLRRYRYVWEIDSVSVRIFDGRDWSTSSGLDLPRKVWTTRDGSSLYCGGPRHSEDPNYGIRPDYRATMSDEEWQAHVEHCHKKERARLPKSVEPYFAEIVEGQKAFKAEYRSCQTWPAAFKGEHRRYPTWREIEREFPVLGAHVAGLRNSQA